MYLESKIEKVFSTHIFLKTETGRFLKPNSAVQVKKPKFGSQKTQNFDKTNVTEIRQEN